MFTCFDESNLRSIKNWFMKFWRFNTIPFKWKRKHTAIHIVPMTIQCLPVCDEHFDVSMRILLFLQNWVISLTIINRKTSHCLYTICHPHHKFRAIYFESDSFKCARSLFSLTPIDESLQYISNKHNIAHVRCACRCEQRIYTLQRYRASWITK